jgi:hypothetical protein
VYTNDICRACNDESVVCLHDFNSSADLSDDEEFVSKRKCVDSDDESKEMSKMLGHALEGMEAKRRRQDEIDKINLDLAKKCDQCEQEEHDERCAKACRKEAQEKQDARVKEWAQVMQMLDHTNPFVQQCGE